MKPVKTAVIGCGAISDIYLSNMIHKYATLDVVACCASHRENAEKKAAQYGIRPAATDEILADPEVELVVVLTPAPSHYELVKKALLAGKHVYTEKPIATELWQAKELVSLAKEKGRLLGAAPETFLGSLFQTGRKALDEGLIGEITSFHVAANRDLTVLASLFKFLRQPGGGICYDYGVYYLTALVSLLGPMAEVYAKVGNHA
jgi:predicted dehydrogenase